MTPHRKSPEDARADVLDVHVLDLLAQVELLLRNVREIQRHALRLRGVDVPGPEMNPRQAIAGIEQRIREMEGDCDGLRSALAAAAEMVGGLSPRRDN